MAATRFSDSATPTCDKIESRPKYTTTSGLTSTTFSRIFRKIVNFTTFPTISGTLESTSGFRIPLPIYRLRLVAPDFLIGSISNRLSAIRRPYGPEYCRKERFWGCRAQTGSRNTAATRFSDSATPTCYNTKSRPKYTTTSGLTSTTFFANFSENT